MEGDFQYVPYESLAEELARIQDVKMAFFEKFWYPSGKDAVRALAAAATEVSLLFFYALPFLFSFVTSSLANWIV